ncbi:hypothetical protein QTN25_007051 [Entamoeba marina]
MEKVIIKLLDSYSMLIVSKYLQTSQDYINLICVNSKFKETTEKLRYNPISVTSLKLFPKIQTQYLYNENDTKINGMDNYEMWYEVDYNVFLKYIDNNIKCHHIIYTQLNRWKYGDAIPNGVNKLGDHCYFYYSGFKTLEIQSSITSIGSDCFSDCYDLKSLTILKFVTFIGYNCFKNCTSLTSITLPHTLLKLDCATFYNCKSLSNIYLPTTLTSLGSNCFEKCTSLNSITLPPLLKIMGNRCFLDCSNLTTINEINGISIGERCFENCHKLKLNEKKYNKQCCLS